MEQSDGAVRWSSVFKERGFRPELLTDGRSPSLRIQDAGQHALWVRVLLSLGFGCRRAESERLPFWRRNQHAE
jgi:hypothetical protein